MVGSDPKRNFLQKKFFLYNFIIPFRSIMPNSNLRETWPLFAGLLISSSHHNAPCALLFIFRPYLLSILLIQSKNVYRGQTDGSLVLGNLYECKPVFAFGCNLRSALSVFSSMIEYRSEMPSISAGLIEQTVINSEDSFVYSSTFDNSLFDPLCLQ